MIGMERIMITSTLKSIFVETFILSPKNDDGLKESNLAKRKGGRIKVPKLPMICTNLRVLTTLGLFKSEIPLGAAILMSHKDKERIEAATNEKK